MCLQGGLKFQDPVCPTTLPDANPGHASVTVFWYVTLPHSELLKTSAVDYCPSSTLMHLAYEIGITFHKWKY